MTRGIKPEVDRFVNDMLAQYLPFKIPKGKRKGEYIVQLAMRPIQLWEVVFPEDQLQTVLRTVFKVSPDERKELKMPMAAMRKVLKLDKIPPIDEKVRGRFVYTDNIGLYPVGIRNDKYDPKDGKENL